MAKYIIMESNKLADLLFELPLPLSMKIVDEIDKQSNQIDSDKFEEMAEEYARTNIVPTEWLNKQDDKTKFDYIRHPFLAALKQITEISNH